MRTLQREPTSSLEAKRPMAIRVGICADGLAGRRDRTQAKTRGSRLDSRRQNCWKVFVLPSTQYSYVLRSMSALRLTRTLVASRVFLLPLLLRLPLFLRRLLRLFHCLSKLLHRSYSGRFQ